MRANGDSSGVRRPPLANSVSSQARPDTNESLSARVNANYYSKNRRTTHTHKPAHTHTHTREKKEGHDTLTHTREREREREREKMHARHSTDRQTQFPRYKRQTDTDKKTDRRIDRHRQTHTPSPLR